MAKKQTYPETLYVREEQDGKETYLCCEKTPEDAVDAMEDGENTVAIYKRVKLVAVERGPVVMRDL